MEEVNSLREKLAEVQVKLQENPMNKEVQKQELEVGKEFKKVSYLAEMMLVQQSKAKQLG